MAVKWIMGILLTVAITSTAEQDVEVNVNANDITGKSSVADENGSVYVDVDSTGSKGDAYEDERQESEKHNSEAHHEQRRADESDYVKVEDEVFVVKLSHGGLLRGSILTGRKGRVIRSFEGIPYAEPPLGELRFRPPVPKARWGKEIHDATTYGRMCVQVDDEIANSLVGDENCLFVNVYSPKIDSWKASGFFSTILNQHPLQESLMLGWLNDDMDMPILVVAYLTSRMLGVFGKEVGASTSKNTDLPNGTYHPNLPVMVFFHGGGFVFGDGGLFGPGHLLDEDIVLVTCNYRIGPLGFLSTSDQVSPGNYGLMDQNLVLQWVKENIPMFGGDNKRVTIFGEGAGAASVIYHIISNKSAGLFQNAIAMSGTPLSPWAFQEDPLIWALRLAADCNCSTDTTTEVVDCLRHNTTADTIVQLANQFMVWGNLPFLYVPSLDGTFLEEHPRKAINSGSLSKEVRLITGVNRDEGILCYMGIHHRLGDTVKRFMSSKDNMEFIVNYLLDDQKNADDAAKLVVEKYFELVDMKNANRTRETLIQIISHAMFEMWHYETALYLSNSGIKTYVYSLDYTPSYNFANAFEFQELSDGVSQGDMLFLLFDRILFGELDPTKKDKEMIQVVRKLWTNFAKQNDPTPSETKLLPLNWKPSYEGKLNIYHINDHLSLTPYEPERDELYKFWTEKVFDALPHTASTNIRDEL